MAGYSGIIWIMLPILKSGLISCPSFTTNALAINW
ncbi:Uncharacterised protein [Vibrio cholerae]|nr:Uncharacterised protein [Vibrio cholerae]